MKETVTDKLKFTFLQCTLCLVWLFTVGCISSLIPTFTQCTNVLCDFFFFLPSILYVLHFSIYLSSYLFLSLMYFYSLYTCFPFFFPLSRIFHYTSTSSIFCFLLFPLVLSSLCFFFSHNFTSSLRVTLFLPNLPFK